MSKHDYDQHLRKLDHDQLDFWASKFKNKSDAISHLVVRTGIGFFTLRRILQRKREPGQSEQLALSAGTGLEIDVLFPIFDEKKESAWSSNCEVARRRFSTTIGNQNNILWKFYALMAPRYCFAFFASWSTDSLRIHGSIKRVTALPGGCEHMRSLWELSTLPKEPLLLGKADVGTFFCHVKDHERQLGKTGDECRWIVKDKTSPSKEASGDIKDLGRSRVRYARALILFF